MANLQPFIYIVIGLLVIGVLFRVIKGVIRLVLTLGVLHQAPQTLGLASATLLQSMGRDDAEIKSR